MISCPACGEENPPKFRLCGYCGTPLAAAAPAPMALPAHELRKTVTLIFCDLKGSTALGETLDAEALHEVKERYFRAMAAEIERHGGKIEKYIGDAIMAVFGLPRAREDDALRAVRAAAGMQAALAQVNAELQPRYGIRLANRTGVNTGEVVANDDPSANQKLATGDAVNVCARLEQAAPEDAIYIGQRTWHLVCDAVEAEPVPPLELKGKAQKVPAWRLVRVHGLDGRVRRHDTPLVGREAELRSIQDVVDGIRRDGGTRMVTIVGDAGIGKSRLVFEIVDKRFAGARLLSGRCLPYGEDITFWPLLSMVHEAAGFVAGGDAGAALERLAERIGDRAVAERLGSVAGLSGSTFALADITWATRRFFASWAAAQPLLVFVDDIHWAAPAFLDLLSQVAGGEGKAPVLLLATARHDLLDARPDWGTQPGALRVVLQPLDAAATAQVVADRLGPGLPPALVQRVVEAAEGNPLYVEQMLSMLAESGALRQVDARWELVPGADTPAVPPTIQALLEARLDQLARADRATVEPAAVIGLEFQAQALSALVPPAVLPTLPAHLETLARKRFIRPASAGALDSGYRFAHHLVRDTVYHGLLKRARAQLHLDFVRWSDRNSANQEAAPAVEEILGYHLEQAHGYLKELGPLDENGLAAGRDAAHRPVAAGRRAAGRGDMHAAASLLRRAAALLPADSPSRLELLPELGDAMMGVADFAGSRAVLDEARAAAAASGDLRLAAASRIGHALLALYSGQPGATWGDDALRTAQELIPQLEARDLYHEAAMAWRLCVMVHGIAGRYGEVDAAVARSIAHARRAGNDRLVARNGSVLCSSVLYGPTPVRDGIALCEQLLAGGVGDRQVEGHALCVLAQLKAMNGELDTARALVDRSRALLRDLGQGVFAASTGIHLARVEQRGGDAARAERELRADHDFLAAKGETYFRSTLAVLLARALRDLDRDAEALALTETAEAISAADDTESHALWRAVRATLLARAGEREASLALAADAVARVQGTESPLLQADVLAEQADVLQRAGRDAEATACARAAIERYARKGDVVRSAELAARWP
jgi:class 3 adenylate cyclase